MILMLNHKQIQKNKMVKYVLTMTQKLAIPQILEQIILGVKITVQLTAKHQSYMLHVIQPQTISIELVIVTVMNHVLAESLKKNVFPQMKELLLNGVEKEIV